MPPPLRCVCNCIYYVAVYCTSSSKTATTFGPLVTSQQGATGTRTKVPSITNKKIKTLPIAWFTIQPRGGCPLRVNTIDETEAPHKTDTTSMLILITHDTIKSKNGGKSVDKQTYGMYPPPPPRLYAFFCSWGVEYW